MGDSIAGQRWCCGPTSCHGVRRACSTAASARHDPALESCSIDRFKIPARQIAIHDVNDGSLDDRRKGLGRWIAATLTLETILDIPRIKEICDLALEGQLSIREFGRVWPSETSQDPLLAQVREDVEDAVEHFFTGFFSRKTPPEWYRSDMYLTLWLDRAVLDYERPSAELLECREHVLGLNSQLAGDIRTAVIRWMSERS